MQQIHDVIDMITKALEDGRHAEASMLMKALQDVIRPPMRLYVLRPEEARLIDETRNLAVLSRG